jgi:Lysylphosphatidylglycerol synthase TM region
MQDNSESNAKPRFLSEKLFLITKWIFVLILGVILYRAFQQKQQNFRDLLNEFSKIVSPKNIYKLGFVIALIFVNWGCEAKKWQILAKKFDNISFIDAYKSVLVGLTLGFITPANLGDFAGRVLHLSKENRLVGFGTVLLGNGIQFYVTLIFGILSYLIIWSENILIFDQLIFGILLFCAVLGVIVFLHRHKFQTYLIRFSWIKPYQNYLNALIESENEYFSKVFLWTIIRFIIYSMQFVIMLRIFHIEVALIDLWAISCLVLLFKTLIPQINFLSDLGVREISALHFFSFYSVNISSVITATFALWIINILLPVIVGSIFLLKIKNTNKTIS